MAHSPKKVPTTIKASDIKVGSVFRKALILKHGSQVFKDRRSERGGAKNKQKAYLSENY